MAKKKTFTKRELRNIRIQQLFFVMIGVIVILTMVIGLIK